MKPRRSGNICLKNRLMTIDLARTRNRSPEEKRALPESMLPTESRVAPLSVAQQREQAEYWRETLSDAPEPLELPADRPRPAEPDPAGAFVRLELDEEVAARLRTLGGRHR